MRDRLLSGFLLLIFSAFPAFGQGGFTTVSGAIVDPSGIPWAGGTISAQFISPGGTTPTLNGQPFTSTTASGLLGPGGTFTMRLGDNGVIACPTSPCGTWQFTINIAPGVLPPLGKGPQSFTVTTAINCGTNTPATCTSNAMTITAALVPVPALSFSGSGSGIPGVNLSPNCSGSVTPCITIPATGGCFQGVTTTAGGLVTYQAGAPSPAPQVGQIAWVALEKGGADTFCGTSMNGTLIADGWSEVDYCGAAGGSQFTITAVNPGVSVQLSGACTAQAGANAWLYYGPNIYSQMVAACTNGANVHISQGIYILDNTGNGTASACGTQVGPIIPNSLTGEGISQSGTMLLTPPWYNHGGDLGTVFYGPRLANITLDGTWTNLNVGIGRGTPWWGLSVNQCGSHDFAIIGYNYGNSATSEMMYPSVGDSLSFNCEIRNATISTGNRGVFGPGPGIYTFSNSNIVSQGPAFFQGTTGGGKVNVIGGLYWSGGVTIETHSGIFAFPGIAGSAATGDQINITNAELCVTGSSPAINDVETSGEVRLTNVKINQLTCQLGTNAGGVTLASGVTLRAVETAFVANGTGNTVNNPSGATFYDIGGNTFSGGAGYTGTGTLFGSSPLAGTLVVAGNLVPSANWGTSAAVSAVTGNATNFTFTLTNGTAAVGANPTIAFTFPTPALATPAKCSVWQVGGTQAITAATEFLTPSALSATGVTLTYNATPTINLTEFYQGSCGN